SATWSSRRRSSRPVAHRFGRATLNRPRAAHRAARRRSIRPVEGGTAMCGIVGYVGYRPVQDVLLAGLEKLEYRGYDSAGISMQFEGQLDSVRAVGNLSALRAAVASVAEEAGRGGVAVAAPPAT